MIYRRYLLTRELLKSLCVAFWMLDLFLPDLLLSLKLSICVYHRRYLLEFCCFDSVCVASVVTTMRR